MVSRNTNRVRRNKRANRNVSAGSRRQSSRVVRVPRPLGVREYELSIRYELTWSNHTGLRVVRLHPGDMGGSFPTDIHSWKILTLECDILSFLNPQKHSGAILFFITPCLGLGGVELAKLDVTSGAVLSDPGMRKLVPGGSMAKRPWSFPQDQWVIPAEWSSTANVLDRQSGYMLVMDPRLLHGAGADEALCYCTLLMRYVVRRSP